MVRFARSDSNQFRIFHLLLPLLLFQVHVERSGPILFSKIVVLIFKCNMDELFILTNFVFIILAPSFFGDVCLGGDL